MTPAKPRVRVPLMAPSFSGQEEQAALRVLRSGMLTQGARVAEYEQAFLDFLSARSGRQAVMTNSGSSANLLALRLLRELANDSFPHLTGRGEVITSPVTWATTVAPAIQMGFTPVFVDVGDDLQMDVEAVERAIGPETVAILPVHIMGAAVDMAKVNALANERGLFVVEDCCEALGVRVRGKHVGTEADAATFSTYLAHHASTIEGGMVVASDRHYKLRAWREHGWTRAYPQHAAERARSVDEYLDERWVFDELGWNLRSTDLNAAIGLVQLRKQAKFKQARKHIDAQLRKRIRVPWLCDIPAPDHVDTNPFWHARILSQDAPTTRRDLQAALAEQGVESRPIVSGNITRHPWYRRNPTAFRVSGTLERADVAHESGILLPLHPLMTRGTLDTLVNAVNDIGGT